MEIIRESEFDRQVEEIAGSHSRMDDIDNMIDWTLSNDFGSVEAIVNIDGEFFLWVTEEFVSTDIPKVRILFTFDGDYTITLKTIEQY